MYKALSNVALCKTFHVIIEDYLSFNRKILFVFDIVVSSKEFFCFVHLCLFINIFENIYITIFTEIKGLKITNWQINTLDNILYNILIKTYAD